MGYDDEDEYDDWELPEPDEDDDESAETVACPACGRPIYEEAEQCPYCHEYVTHSTSVLVGKPLWYIALALLGIVAVVAVLLH